MRAVFQLGPTKSERKQVLARVRERCSFPDGEGACWLWLSREPGAVCTRPMMKLRRTLVSVRRAVAFLRDGVMPASNECVIAKCGKPNCVSPRCVKVLSWQATMRRAAVKRKAARPKVRKPKKQVRKRAVKKAAPAVQSTPLARLEQARAVAGVWGGLL